MLLIGIEGFVFQDKFNGKGQFFLKPMINALGNTSIKSTKGVPSMRV